AGRTGRTDDGVANRYPSEKRQLGVVADDAVKVEVEHVEHRLGDGPDLFLDVVLVVDLDFDRVVGDDAQLTLF
ncbi:MAG: hypothetical protein AAGF23_19510, partial [Acidobacteriota bacterium]